MFQKIWDFCGEVKVNFWLLLLISANLGIGSYYLKFNFAFFNPLNQMLIQEWVQQVGRSQINQLWWLGSLILLLFFLGVNTVVCALKRLIHLWPLRKQIGVRTFSVRLSPSLIHLCFLVILSGHWISLVVGFNGVVPNRPETGIQLPGAGIVRVINQDCQRYPGPEPIRGMVQQCRAVLLLDAAGSLESRELRIMQPVSWKGYTFHLDMAKKAQPGQELKVVIKQDPGRHFIFWGFVVLILALVWYFPQRKSV